MPALLLTPLLVFLLTFFVLPFGVMLVESLYLSPLQSPAGSAMTFANYAKAFGDAFYLRVLLQTVALGVAVTGLALVLGYPVAYFLARTRSRRRHVLLFLVISPLVVSIVIRSYGWMVLLGRAGTVNTLLVALGLAERPLPLMYNWFGVIVALTHVLLPLSMEGVGAGVTLVFMLTIGSFVSILLLGGSDTLVLPLLIYQQISLLNNNFAAALGMLLLVLSLALLYAQARVFRVRGAA